jgi:hypothetical protein
LKLNPGLPRQKQYSTRRLFSLKIGLLLKVETNKVLHLEHSFVWCQNFAIFWEVDLKYVESIEMSCWRRVEKTSWIDGVKNKDVLHRVNDEKNILHQLKRRKADWIRRILRRK